jgi:hypothetical protein
MQLPLSASALVVLGAGAVLVGALILIVVAVRRRKPANRAHRVPPDMRTPQQLGSRGAAQVTTLVEAPVADAPVVSAPVMSAPADAPVAAPQAPARLTGPAVPMPAAPAPVEHVSAPVESPLSAVAPEPRPLVASEPQPQPQSQPLAVPVAAAAARRPAEASGHAEPSRESAQAPSAQEAAPQRHHQSGSGRTVAAAVAQAFAVRAAASRGATQRPAGPPPPEEPAAGESTPVQPEPDAPAVDDVDPAATTDPEGHGLAAAPPADAAPEPAVVDVPEQGGDVWAVATAAEAVNGADHGSEGNGQAPEGWRVPEPAPDGQGAAEAPAAAPAVVAATAPVPAEQPEPAPHPDTGIETDTGIGAASGIDTASGAVAQDVGPAPDARDRLLAVLLDDPERAVGAAVELESCLRELDRLSDAVRTGRTALRDVLVRLSSAGLRPEQLARLARLPQHEVEELLTPA